jgi:hypothetical protein
MCRRTLRRHEIDRGLEWIDAFRRHEFPRGFTRSAGLHRVAVPAAKLSRISGGAPTAFVARYAFPPGLASMAGVVSSSTVDLSAVLAVFDEVSSWAFFDADRTHRPGVSVHLSAVAQYRSPDSNLWSAGNDGAAVGGVGLLRAPEVGEPLDVVVHAPQCGRSLGFVSVELRRGSNVLVTGKHVKALPMPGLGPGKLMPWDVVFAPALGALPMHLLLKTGRRAESGLSTGEGEVARAWFADLRPTTTRTDAISVGGGGARTTWAAALATTTDAQVNGMGTTHGGFQAMLAEAGARWALAQRAAHAAASSSGHGGGPGSSGRAMALSTRPLRALSANYLAAHRRGPLHVQATLPAPAPPMPQQLQTEGASATREGAAGGETVEVSLVDPRTARRTCEAALHFF